VPHSNAIDCPHDRDRYLEGAYIACELSFLYFRNLLFCHFLLHTARVRVPEKTCSAASHTFDRTSLSSGLGRLSNLVAPLSDPGMQARCDCSKVCPAGTHAAAWVLTPETERVQQRLLVGHRQHGSWRPLPAFLVCSSACRLAFDFAAVPASSLLPAPPAPQSFVGGV